jgi:signal transduction histidine kinase/CheY-like chemotaxis protein
MVDTSDHGGVSHYEGDTLSTVAKQCMSQLEQDLEIRLRRRGSRMTEGLSTLLQQRPAVDQMLDEPTAFRGPAQQVLSKQSEESNSKPEQQWQGESETNEPSISRPQQARAPSSPKRKQSSKEQDETPYRRVFRRAAEFLRTSLDADGVLFADGFVGFHGSMLPAAEPEQELEREMVQADKEQVSHGDSEQPHETTRLREFTSTDYRKHTKTESPAEILGIAMRPDTVKPKFQQISQSSAGLDSVNEGFLQYLMEKHPQSKIWYFDDGQCYCEGETLSSEESNDIDRLRHSFRGVRQLLFAPLRDPVDIKRLAGCFVWSTRVHPRLLGADLPSLDTFLHIVEAEISRNDTIAALKQKESFMASVSHELRSPLHGILGAVDLLIDGGLDNFQESLADTIRACGTTLHETLSSVLSFTKINQFERRRDHPRPNLSGLSPWSLKNKDLVEPEDTDGMLVCTNVAGLCEEVVEVALSGHASDLAITLEVAYCDWNFLTEPGALRRIMMNIIGNALKYTAEGGIKISLHVEHNNGDKEKTGGDPPKNIIVFTVEDSGKGMSNAFLEDRLFVPFSQEDPLSDGIGLGMSIVKSLITLLGGEIKVESHLSEGTTMIVNIPMRASERQSTLERNVAALRKTALRVGISPPTMERTLRAYLERWFGCTIVSWSEADVAFVADEGLPARRDGGPIIVAVGRKRTKSGRKGNNSQRISEPFGPWKVSKALLKSLESAHKPNITDTSGDAGLEATQKQESLSIGTDCAGQRLDATSGITKPATSPIKGIMTEPAAWSANLRIPNRASGDEEGVRDASPAILLVEDNAINLRLLLMHLKKGGYRDIETAENGLLAVQAVERRKEGFGAIVMDLSMPEMDGFEATRRIRKLEQQRHQPPTTIVALTGLASAGDRAKAYECGVSTFMTKPLKFQELASLLAGCPGNVKR